MPSVLRPLGQAVAYAATAGILGVFSIWPSMTPPRADAAYITVSFVHGGARAECRQRTAEELGRLAPNMRRPTECARERSPIRIEIVLDGSVLLRKSLAPAGLSKDGPSRLYERLTTAASSHELTLQLADNRDEGYNHKGAFKLLLAPGQNVLVDFMPERGGFVVR